MRHLWFARSSSSRTRRQRHAREDLLEQWRWRVAEQALGGGGAIGAADVKVVHGGERGELAIAQAMAAMVMERELAVAALDRGAGALEQIGTVAGHLLEVGARVGVERLDRMVWLQQRLEDLGAQGAQVGARLGPGSARGDALEVERRDQLLQDSLFDIRRQAQGLDALLHGGEEESHRRQQRGGQAPGFGQMCLRSRRQVGRLGEACELLPNALQARGQALGRLRLGALQVVGVIRLAKGAYEPARLQAAGLRLVACDGESQGSRTLPVIMLSAKGEEQAIVRALEAEADDFVCKPLSIRELVARIKAILRRTQDPHATEERELRRGDPTSDLVAKRVWLKNQELPLRLCEFDLLAFLVQNDEQTFSRGALMEQIWKTQRDRLDRTVDIHVSRLRKALAVQPAEGLIQTVHRTGYRLSLRH